MWGYWPGREKRPRDWMLLPPIGGWLQPPIWGCGREAAAADRHFWFQSRSIWSSPVPDSGQKSQVHVCFLRGWPPSALRWGMRQLEHGSSVACCKECSCSCVHVGRNDCESQWSFLSERSQLQLLTHRYHTHDCEPQLSTSDRTSSDIASALT